MSCPILSSSYTVNLFLSVYSVIKNETLFWKAETCKHEHFSLLQQIRRIPMTDRILLDLREEHT